MRIRLIAVLVALAAVAVFTTEASAMYHAGMGVFMQRDPGAGAGGPARMGAGGAPAATGRFIPRDPTGSDQYAGGMNLYGYVRQNPTARTDPSGLLDWSSVKSVSPPREEREGWPVGTVSRGEVKTSKGGTIVVWKDAYSSINCHSYTFGGWNAAGGPWLILDGVRKILDDEWQAIPCCWARRNDILAFGAKDGEPTHTGIISRLGWEITSQGTKPLESFSQISHVPGYADPGEGGYKALIKEWSWGSTATYRGYRNPNNPDQPADPPIPSGMTPETAAPIAYGNYRCYTKRALEQVKSSFGYTSSGTGYGCCVPGDHELPFDDWMKRLMGRR